MEHLARISWVDLIIIIIVLRSTYAGSQRGFFGELFHIAGICLAIVLSMHFYAPLGCFIHTYLYIPINIANVTTFLAITYIIYLIFRIIYGLSSKLIKIEMFPAINKMGGALLGFCRGSVLSIFLVLIMLLTPIHYITESVKTRSLFSPFFIKTGISLYEKSLGLFSWVEARGLEEFLEGAEPIKFHMLQFKKKNKLDKILDE